MRKKRLLFFIVLGVLLSITAGVTGAWFASSATSSGNTFKAGTMEITGPGDAITSDMISIQNIYPGWEQFKVVNVINSGTLDFYCRMRTINDNLAGNPFYDGAFPLKIKVFKGQELIKEYTNLNELGYLEIGQINPGQSKELTIHFKLPEEAGNEYQGESVNVSFAFEARQDAEGVQYPGENDTQSVKVNSIYIKGEGGASSIDLAGGTLQMTADIKPENASDKRVKWYVERGSGNAIVNEEGLLTGVADEEVTVKAVALDGSGVSGIFKVFVNNQSVQTVSSVTQLEEAIMNPNTTAVNLTSGTYPLGKMQRNISSRNVTIYCNEGDAIVAIDSKAENGNSIKPQNVVVGPGVTVYENVTYVGSGLNKHYSKIQDAINDAREKEIIFVFKNTFGFYNENIEINKPLTLLGAQAHIMAFSSSIGTVSLREVTSRESFIFVKSGDAIKLTGERICDITIKGLKIQSTAGACITANGDLSNVTIENNLFPVTKENNQFLKSKSVIDFKDVNINNLIIKGNALNSWSGEGVASIDLQGGSTNRAVICNNFIQNSTNSTVVKESCGIGIENGVNLEINDNIIQNLSRYAIGLTNSSSIRCSSNIIKNAAYGVQALSAKSGLRDIDISSNTFNNIKGIGIYISRDSEDSLNPGVVEGINISRNTINLNNYDLINASDNCGAIHLCLDNNYSGMHGTIDIEDNSIKFFKGANKPIVANGLMILGKVNVINVLRNDFDGGGELMAAIYINYNGREFGAIPYSAVITMKDNSFSGFLQDVLDTRPAQ